MHGHNLYIMKNFPDSKRIDYSHPNHYSHTILPHIPQIRFLPNVEILPLSPLVPTSTTKNQSGFIPQFPTVLNNPKPLFGGLGGLFGLSLLPAVPLSICASAHSNPSSSMFPKTIFKLRLGCRRKFVGCHGAFSSSRRSFRRAEKRVSSSW